MKEKIEKKHDLRIILSEAQYADLWSRFQTTKFRTIPEYVRALLCQEPVVKRYRNQSLDDILEALVDLKREVSEMDFKLTDAMTKIATAKQVGPEVAAFLLAEQFGVKGNIEYIKSLLLKIYHKCDQKEYQSPS